MYVWCVCVRVCGDWGGRGAYYPLNNLQRGIKMTTLSTAMNNGLTFKLIVSIPVDRVH